VLLPTLGKAREQATRVKCLSNIRQMTIATQMYASMNNNSLPYSNWGETRGGYTNVRVGWLYDGIPGLTGVPQLSFVETGAFWPLLKNREVYRCPSHVKGESGSFGKAWSDALTSFLMNGAVNSYGRTDGTAIKQWKLNKFQVDDMLFWEADERGTYAWNDGSSNPSESYNPADPYSTGLSARHGKVASAAYFGGHAAWISHGDFYRLAVQADGKRNAVYCAPDSTNGR
jgi:hypothetical protein